MSRDDTPLPQPVPEGRDPGDALLERYREASALDPARPSPALREAVLAQARAATAGQAASPTQDTDKSSPESIAEYYCSTLGRAQRSSKTAVLTPAPARKAANDASWRIRAVAGVAVLGLATLLFLQFERGAPEERDLALGAPAAPSASRDAHQTPGQADKSGPAGAPALATAKGPAEASALPSASSGTASPPPAPPTAALVDPPVAPADSARRERAAAETAAPIDQTRSAPVQPAIPGGRDAGAPAHDGPLTDGAPRSATAASPPSAAPPATPAASQAARATSQNLQARARAPQPAIGRSTEDDKTLQSGGASASSQRLLAAVANGALEAARQALKEGASVNAPDAAGQTPLMIAARRGDEALVRLLLAAGADRTSTDPAGLAAAEHARRAGHEILLPLLTPPESAPPAQQR